MVIQIILLLMCNELLTMVDLKTVVCLFAVYLLRLVPNSCKFSYLSIPRLVTRDLSNDSIDCKPLYHYCYYQPISSKQSIISSMDQCTFFEVFINQLRDGSAWYKCMNILDNKQMFNLAQFSRCPYTALNVSLSLWFHLTG